MFAQTNYPQSYTEGSTIAEAGSLLTAFSNLLERFGSPVDPPTLLHYLDTQGVTKPYDWSTVIAYDGNLQVTTSDINSLPKAVDSIVSFEVNNKLHYCVVASLVPFQIVDSLDGLVKDNPYGNPFSWGAYTYTSAAVPVLPKEQLLHMDETVDGIHYHNYGSPKRMYVRNPKGTSKIDFGNNATNLRDFYGIPNTDKAYGEMVRIMGIARYPAYPAIPDGQVFYMDMDDWGEFTRIGKVRELHGYFEADLQDALPPPKKKEATPSAVVTGTSTAASIPNYVIAESTSPIGKPMTDIIPKAAINTDDFRFRYLRADRQPVKYQVMQPNIWVKDFSARDKPQELPKDAIVGIYGTFRPYGDDTVRLLLKRKGEQPFDHWYGVGEINPDGKRIVEKVPDEVDVPDDGIKTAEETKAVKKQHHDWGILDDIWEFFLKHDAKVFNRKRSK